MAGDNDTAVSEFILLAFTDSPDLLVPIFTLFLVIYIITVVGNLGMITLISVDSQLHTPMYFFLGNLAFVDFCCSSTIAPKAMENFLAEKKTISSTGCFVQFSLFIALVSAECMLLAIMAYDRYVAICNPLLYTTVMSWGLCLKMSAGSYALCLLISMVHTTLISRLSFCHTSVINHFFCDSPQLFKLSCSDTHLNETLIFITAGVNTLSSILIILTSYMYILFAILRIPSTQSRHKAFSTCTSHLMVVTLSYGTGFFIYLQPSSNFTHSQNQVMSVFCTLVIPMLNPLIYSLRNKEVKAALRRLMGRKLFCHIL
ncbi:olfactory receptor 5F1-like [Carettochelys insculpta]|uniref:olfactory receptor 5F1-like n=1 Tax=Carettochelys insculpta TaxID=44489 RepID=UPI003EB9E5D7